MILSLKYILILKIYSEYEKKNNFTIIIKGCLNKLSLLLEMIHLKYF